MKTLQSLNKRSKKLLLAIFIVSALSSIECADAQTREEKVRADKKRVEDKGFWLYNDLSTAFARAKKENKPILVSMRCIPCEECVKLDEELIDNDPEIKSLLDQFVCVRVVGTNGLDLGIFQFDTDQSFAMFMLNADETIYGRYGTRSHRTEWKGDVSIKGLSEALKGALKLHRNFDANKKALADKRGDSLEFPTPESYPTLRTRYLDKLDYAGNVVKSCIHCHQIGDARLDYYWNNSQPIPDKLMFPFPHPKSIGLVLDPDTRGTIKSVTQDSPASKTDLKPGDEILKINGQPILSIADVQWVLHHSKPNGDKLTLMTKRNGKQRVVGIALPKGWRELDDRSWRVSSWGFRGTMLGGLKLETLSDSEKRKRGIKSQMALLVDHVGQYGKHATAKRAGIKKGDIIVEYDGMNNLSRESDLFAYAAKNLKPKQIVEIKYMRGDKIRSVKIPMQTR